MNHNWGISVSPTMCLVKMRIAKENLLNSQVYPVNFIRICQIGFKRSGRQNNGGTNGVNINFPTSFGRHKNFEKLIVKI